MKIRYVGPSARVLVVATGQWVKRGDTADINQKVARQLVKQAVWESVKDDTKDKADG